MHSAHAYLQSEGEGGDARAEDVGEVVEEDEAVAQQGRRHLLQEVVLQGDLQCNASKGELTRR